MQRLFKKNIIKIHYRPFRDAARTKHNRIVMLNALNDVDDDFHICKMNSLRLFTKQFHESFSLVLDPAYIT